MNILFLTLVDINSLSERGIYTDLLRHFVQCGHDVTIVCPKERRKGVKSNIQIYENHRILQVKTFNIVSTNIIEKGIGTLAIEYQYLMAIRKYLADLRFDLIIYSTPPITFPRLIKTIKKRDKARTYLLLKDIFPQNAVDLGMMKKDSILYRFFRHKEKKLYRISDYIGCMSPANVAYLLKHNPQLSAAHVEVCPNSIEPEAEIGEKDATIRHKYCIPANATVFIYGGNLGKPQGLEFLTEVLEKNNGKTDRFFIVIGSGTEKRRLTDWFRSHPLSNAVLLDLLPKEAYDRLIRSCDVGMIFLDRRFTIPNYPSRILSYLENSMPVITATDPNTDVGSIAEDNGFGLGCLSGDIGTMMKHIQFFCENPVKTKEMGRKGYEYLKNNYTVQHSYNIIMKHFQN